jgi:hypothetical protein
MRSFFLLCALGMYSPITFEPQVLDRPENAAYTTSAGIGFVDMETPGVLAGGTLALSYEPTPAQSLMLFRNGVPLVGNSDFTTAGNIVTLRVQAAPSDKFVAWYRHWVPAPGATVLPVSSAGCPTGLGSLSYSTTEFGVCGGNGSTSQFYTYWDTSTRAPTANHFVFFGDSRVPGKQIDSGLALTTRVGVPGLNTNVPTEAAVSAAIAAALKAFTVTGVPGPMGPAGPAGAIGLTGPAGPAGSGTGSGGFATGPSGALDCVDFGPGVCDLVTALVPLKANANVFTGVDKFQQLQVALFSVAKLPACNAGFEGQIEGVSDALNPAPYQAIVGGGAVHVPVYCNGSAWVAH